MKYIKFTLLILIGLLSISCMMMMEEEEEEHTRYYISTMNPDGSNYDNLVISQAYSTLKFSHDDEKIIMRADSGFWTVDTDGSDYHQIKSLGYRNDNYFSVSPVLSEIAYSFKDSLYILNHETEEQFNLFPDWEVSISDPSYSPDGNYIIFSTLKNITEQQTVLSLYRVNSDGTNRQLLLAEAYPIATTPFRHPIYTDDQNGILFNFNGIRKYDFANQTTSVIFENEVSSSPIQIANDYLVFGSSGQIYCYDFGSEKIVNLGAGLYPSISPDGSKVVFRAHHNNLNGIDIVNIDGTDKQFYSEYDNPSPVFSSTGDKIALRGQKYIKSESKPDPIGIDFPASILDK